ncbi:MAG: restriction endonuclease subunit S, partial [Rhodospirillales bacterium]|nr:restriction endonuclease subunit S [Rhodospirillales bacterium]
MKPLDPEAEVTFAPMDALADGLGGLDTSRVKPFSEVARGSYNYFREGDILLAKVTPCFENGKKAIAQGLTNGVGYATSEVYVLRPNRGKIEPRFLLYLLCSEDFRAVAMQSMTGAGGLRRVSENGVLDYRPKITDLATQKAIAAFLDRETARIDGLIETKQRFVALLGEKRSALITAAVTGGIDPLSGQYRTPEAKGGVMYWGETVRSSLRPLKHCCHVNPAVLPETTDPDWEFDYIDIGSVSLSEGVTCKERMRFADSPSRARKPVREGDILVSTVRTYLKAIAAIQPADTPQVASTGFAVLQAKKGVDTGFLYRVVQSNPFIEQVVAKSTGVSYPAISPSTLSNIKVPLPDLATQKAIADFLDRETARIDRITGKTQQS